MFRVIAVTAMAALAAAQSEFSANDGSINIETREGENKSSFQSHTFSDPYTPCYNLVARVRIRKTRACCGKVTMTTSAKSLMDLLSKLLTTCSGTPVVTLLAVLPEETVMVEQSGASSLCEGQMPARASALIDVCTERSCRRLCV